MQIKPLSLVFKISLTVVGSIGTVVATPLIGVPNIIYKVTESSTQGRGGELLTKELYMFNADVRGELLKTGHYRIVDMQNKFTLTQSQLSNVLANTDQIQLSDKLVESATNPVYSPSANSESEETRSKYLKPEYILVGFLTNQDSGENIYPLSNSNKITQTYSSDILVEYRLIDYDTKQIVASFSANGHGSDLKIMTNNNDGRVIHYNYNKALKEASKDLAANVIAELDIQFKISNKVKQDEAPLVITDVKTYSDD